MRKKTIRIAPYKHLAQKLQEIKEELSLLKKNKNNIEILEYIEKKVDLEKISKNIEIEKTKKFVDVILVNGYLEDAIKNKNHIKIIRIEENFINKLSI